MLIDCPSCARSYHVSRAALGERGRTVVCPLCDARWYIEAAEATPMPDDKPDDLWAGRAAFAGGRPIFEERITSRDSAAAAPAFASAARRAPIFERPRPAKRTKRPSSRGAGNLLQIGLGLACVLLAMGLIAKRNIVVAAAPRTAALYAAIGIPVNIRDLEFADVKVQGLDDAGHVEISGRIRNIARSKTVVPRMTFDIRDAAGVTVSSWSEKAPKRSLSGDESVAFVTQPPALPSGSKDVVVRFDGGEPRGTSLVGPAIH